MSECHDYSPSNRTQGILNHSKQRIAVLAQIKKNCLDAINKMDTDQLFNFALEILKKNPEERIQEEIEVLMKATENLKYFQELNKKKKHINANTHQKICARMQYEAVTKGKAVVNYGDPASKLYILFKGSAGLFLPKDNETFTKEISEKNNLNLNEKLLKKLINWQDEKMQPLLLQKETLAMKKRKTEGLLLRRESESNDLTERRIFKSVKDNFNEIEIQKLKKIEDYMLGLSIFYLQNPEKYFSSGIFKFTFLNTIQKGHMFGEVGLSMRKPRAASIVCFEDSEFAILDADDFTNILKKIEKKEIEDRVSFFAENFCRSLRSEVVLKISLNFVKQSFCKDRIIYNQGDEPNEVYIIKKGEVQVSYKKEVKEEEEISPSIEKLIKKFKTSNIQKIESKKHKTIPLVKFGKGELFGEEEIIKNCTRSSTAQCTSNKVTLFVISKQKFEKILQNNPIILDELLGKLKKKKAIIMDQLKNFHLRSIEQEKKLQTFFIRRDINEMKELNDDNVHNNPPKRLQTAKHDEINIASKILSSYSNTTREIYIPNQKLLANRNFKEKNKKIKFPSVSNIRLKLFSREENNDNDYENMNKIEYIVKKNKENLDSLIENNTNEQGLNIYKILLENHAAYTRSSKASHLHRSKYKNYKNSDPIYNQPNKKFKNMMERIKTNINQENESEKYVEIGPIHSRRIVSLKEEESFFNNTNKCFRSSERQISEFKKDQMNFFGSKTGMGQTWN